MATITPVGYQPISARTGATAGQAVPSNAASGGGDNVLASGTWLLLSFATTGTASVVTIDSVAPSNYGTDVNVTVTMGATDYQEVMIYLPDLRFIQPAGAGVPGSVALTYTSVVGLTVRARYLS
jgi:hypothetical protein